MRDINEVKVKIDRTVTFFEVHDVEEHCTMYEFAHKRYENYRPEDGFGYYKPTGDELTCIPDHKKLILMEKVCFIHNIVCILATSGSINWSSSPTPTPPPPHPPYIGQWHPS